jgi:hypothetical protein
MLQIINTGRPEKRAFIAILQIINTGFVGADPLFRSARSSYGAARINHPD